LVDLVSVQEQISTLGNSYISMDCYMVQSTKGATAFYYKTLLFFVAPFCLPFVVVTFLTCWSYSLYRDEQAVLSGAPRQSSVDRVRSRLPSFMQPSAAGQEAPVRPVEQGDWLKRSKDVFFTTHLVIMYLAHPALTLQALKIFRCV
jgi:hypothetical protein